MSQAIITKFISATNTRGARIKATSWKGSITISYDCALGGESHHAAAQALCDKMRQKQQGVWIIAANADLPNQAGRVFIIDWVTA